MAAAASRDSSGNTVCPDCGGNRFVEDRAAGDVVCYNCGLVVEAHLIDERSEWRTFSDKDKEGTDPNRVGGPTNPLLEGGGLSTIIGKGRDGDNSYMLNRLHTRSNNPDRALISAFKKMGEICESMQMSSTVVRDSACEIYKMAAESGRLKGRGVMPICAACLYMACRQSNVPRTFKEITAAMPAEVSKKDIGRCFQELLKLQREVAITKPNANAYLQQQAPLMKFPVDYMKRFTAELRLDFHTQKACQAMALAAKPKEESQASKLLPWDSRSPVSVAAAILYAATNIKSKPGERITLQDIYMVTNVAITTVKAVYKELYSHIEMLLPPGVSLYEALSKLPVPEGFPKPNLAKIAPPPAPVQTPSTSTPMQGSFPGAASASTSAAMAAMPGSSGAAMPGFGAGGAGGGLNPSVPSPLAQASQMVQQHLAQQAQQAQRGTAGQPGQPQSQAQGAAAQAAIMPPPPPRTLNPQQQQQLAAQQKAAASAAAAQQGLSPQQLQQLAQQRVAAAAAQQKAGVAQQGLSPQQVQQLKQFMLQQQQQQQQQQQLRMQQQ